MAEVNNTNVFDAAKKFVDFAGLDYFWGKAKAYVDYADNVTADKVAILEGVVGNDVNGLVKDLADLRATINAMDVEDVAVAGKYVSSVSEVDGKVVVTREDLPVYEEVGVAAGLNAAMDVRVKDLEAIAHTHANKAELDKIVDGDKAKWDAAVGRLETFLDSEKIEGTVDTLHEIQNWMNGDGVNATELTEAIAAEAKLRGEADSAMDVRIKDLEDHKEDYKAYADQAEADANSYADGLNGAMNTRVAALEAIDHDAYKAADETVLASAKSYADGLAVNYDAAGSAEAAQTAAEAYAKTYTDQLYASIKFTTNSDIDTLFEWE